MPSVKIEENIVKWLAYTRKLFILLPIELQLVWLYEIMVRTCLRDKPYLFKQVKDSYTINSKIFYKSVSNDESEMDSLATLCKFRNHFVHLGYFDILDDWNDCVLHKLNLNNLANQYGVSLNWS